MALQIANPIVVAKVETLAKLTGLSKTGAVEQAVDKLLNEQKNGNGTAKAIEWQRIRAILRQMDQLPRIENPVDPLEWDENGLPI